MLKIEWTPSWSSSLVVDVDVDVDVDVETVAESKTLTSAPNNFATWTFPVLSNRLLSGIWAYPPPVALWRIITGRGRFRWFAMLVTWMVWLLWRAPSVTRVASLFCL